MNTCCYNTTPEGPLWGECPNEATHYIALCEPGSDSADPANGLRDFAEHVCIHHGNVILNYNQEEANNDEVWMVGSLKDYEFGNELAKQSYAEDCGFANIDELVAAWHN
jgi:hypothetical protein